MSPEIKTFIDEQKAEKLEAAARLADDYALTHKVNFIHKQQRSFPSQYTTTTEGRQPQKFKYNQKESLYNKQQEPNKMSKPNAAPQRTLK